MTSPLNEETEEATGTDGEGDAAKDNDTASPEPAGGEDAQPCAKCSVDANPRCENGALVTDVADCDGSTAECVEHRMSLACPSGQTCKFAACTTPGPVKFNAAQDITRGAIKGVSSLVAGDLNGDGRADVVVAEGGKHAEGRIFFAWYEAPASAELPWIRHDFVHSASLRPFLGAAELADVNQDGRLDLVLTSDMHSGETAAADVLVFYNPADAVAGMWKHTRLNEQTMAVHHINDIEVADMDGDGMLDVVVRALSPNQVHVFFQNAQDKWTLRSMDTGLPDSEGLGVGQVDGRAGLDITFSGFWFQSSSTPRQDNYVKLPIDSEYATINQNTKEFLSDIDGDGLLDVVIVPAESYRNGADHVLAWYKNPGDNYQKDWQQHVLSAGINDCHALAGNDVDGDGDIDVLAGRAWNNTRVELWYNDGAGNFGNPQVVDGSQGMYTAAIVDVDADGDVDLVGHDTYAKESRPWVYLNQR